MVFADIIKFEMMGSLEWPLINMTGIIIRGKTGHTPTHPPPPPCEDTDTEGRRPCEDRGRKWKSNVAPRQGTWGPSDAGRGEEGSSPRDLRGSVILPAPLLLA